MKRSFLVSRCRAAVLLGVMENWSPPKVFRMGFGRGRGEMSVRASAASDWIGKWNEGSIAFWGSRGVRC